MRPAWSTANPVSPSRWPWSVRERLSGTLPVAFALNGGASDSESVCTTTPSVVIASPVALTVTESANSILGGTVWTTRGWAVAPDRTNTLTGEADPGWRLPSSDVEVTVTRPRIGAFDGTRAVVVKVTS